VVRLVKILTRSAAETSALGQSLGNLLVPGDVVAMTGALGTGKSVLARGMMAGLGVTSKMPSPSFVLVATYEGRLTVNHIDLYRLERPEDALAIGIEDLVYSQDICLIEWAERAVGVLPTARLDVNIESRALPEERLVTLTPLGLDLGQRLLPLVRDWGAAGDADGERDENPGN
jgi:tRNA threonylcarbamoyladenosine biosynthesis protein TsaE